MKKIALITALAASAVTTSFGQVTTEAVGFNTVTCLVGSDTRLSVPLCPETAFVGTIGTATGSGPAVITPSSATTWTVNQFATYYYVKVTSGARAGWFYQITENSATNLTIDLAGDTLGIAANDGFRVCKFWTLDTLFPVATQTTIVPSLNTTPVGRRTEVLIPNLSGSGINLAPNQAFIIDASAAGGPAWKKTAGFALSGNFIISPDSFFIVRHANPNITTSTTFTVVGGVDMNPVANSLATLATGKQDNPVTTGRPVPVALADLDLIATGAFIASAGQSPGARRDELLVYDNTVAGINKSPIASYFFDSTTNNWKKSSGFVISDSVTIAPSEGFIIRKFTGSGNSVTWTHSF